MSDAWERRRILVWGKTRPEVSRNYRETVCTGGVFEDTGRLVRLYPIPLRFLDDEKYFKKYQWITADVQPAGGRDRRPESYRIKFNRIEVGETLGTGRDSEWAQRAAWVLKPSNVFQSVEALKARQAVDNTSLGVVKPKRIVQVHVEAYDRRERDEFWRKYQDTVRQLPLTLDDEQPVQKPLTPPDFRFMLRFTCDDPACTGVHKFSILDWEIDALYFRMKQKYDPQRATREVVDTLEKQLMAPEREARFFLGNIANYPDVFTIVGLWWPKRPGRTLFDDPDAGDQSDAAQD